MEFHAALFTLWCMMNIDKCKEHMNEISDQAMQATNKHTTPFMLNLYREIAPRTNQRNVLISPISVITLLGMISAGAQGPTDREITDVLGWDSMNEIAAHSGMKRTLKIVNSYSDNPNASVLIANAIFVQDGYRVLKRYQKAVSDSYSVHQMLQVDFSKSATREMINKYVANRTDNLIQESIPPNAIDSNTRMVLCNILFFRAAWEKPFPEFFTFVQNFKLSNDKTVKAEMMSQTDQFNYGRAPEIGARIVELKYLGLNVSMYILLPELENQSEDPLNALNRMKHKITKNRHFINGIDGLLKEKTVLLGLPKFKMTEDYNLKKYLPDLGIKKVFDPYEADLSGITGRRYGLHVSAVLLKTHIQVDEKGSVGAASSTGAVGSRSSRTITFFANRPFAFYIYDKATSAVLFFGQLIDPTQGA